MGDRGNVKLVYGTGEEIYLYAHWEGSRLPEMIRDALKRGESRWDDEAYLARIIFSELIRDHVDGMTGYGIAPYCMDGGETVILYLVEQNVEIPDLGLRASFKEYTSDLALLATAAARA